MLAERIKTLREQAGMSQEKLAKRLGITRSSVNAWEMGISTPSTQYIAELAGLFRVSADYLLGLNETATVSIAGLTEADVGLVCHLISHLRGGAEREK
ncbi:MAG: helix-turn-helix transcriptional regulator [Oscillospiraceae bacterium]|mgnify:FL=1|jgi:transcriptional regulator with XRE-family HTH domain|nr:helix-turn-helix transcriptional regulator [Oscillospiraceae bacterium]MCI8757954.1 helix-turn-helix transcriptional regulator [Oscillospiraceae bacterium]MCI9564003.1 helix-turn-helix transcriptional regulator [Oscillospiraceae bacterium]